MPLNNNQTTRMIQMDKLKGYGGNGTTIAFTTVVEAVPYPTPNSNPMVPLPTLQAPQPSPVVWEPIPV
jgi:hypothetical protein